MDNLRKLEYKIRGSGWYAGQLKLLISVLAEFEGFYGRASESWETLVVIEIVSPDPEIIKSIKVVGERGETIDDVAKKVLREIDIARTRDERPD